MNDSTSTTIAETDGYGDDSRKRPHPELRDYFNPKNATKWALEFLDAWLHSRSYRQFAIGMPFLIVAVTGIGFVWWLRSASYLGAIQQYENAVVEALEEEDSEKVHVYLRQLLKLRPTESRYKMQLVLFLVENGQTNAAIPYLNQLLETQYLPARMWIVQQAEDSDVIIPQSQDQIVNHLQSVVSVEPAHYEANHRLAEIRMSQGQFRLAESHLIAAIQQRPELGLALAKLQMQLGSRDDQVKKHLNMALAEYELQTRQNPSSVESRIGWAETLSTMERFGDAEIVLKEGKSLNDDSRFNVALSNLYMSLATKRIRDNMNNRELSAGLLLQAAILNPENRNAILGLTSMIELGVTADVEALNQILEYWKAVVEKSGEAQDRILLANLYAASEKIPEAIAELEFVVDENPQIRAALARLYASNDQTQKSQALLDTILEEQKQKLTDNPDDVAALARSAEALIIAKRYEDCRQLLQEIVLNTAKESLSSLSETEKRQRAVLASMYGQACLLRFDEVVSADDADQQTDPMTLIEDARRSGGVNLPLIQRLSRLSVTEDPLAAPANRVLNSMLATGKYSDEVYKQLGAVALQANQYEKAVEFLQRANKLRPRAADVLNNLAMALVRSSANNAERAMELANEALEILPDHPDVLATRGEIYMATNQWNLALTDLERALLQRQDNSTVHRLLATVYDTMGESELAEQHRKIMAKLGSI